MGNADLSLHHRAIDFIKKNEGYREISYPDVPRKKTKRKPKYAICWGNQFLENGSRIKHISKFSKTRCEKIIHTHFYKRVLPKIPKEIKGFKFIAYCDTVYQFGTFKEKYIKKYPERGRWKLWNEKNK